MKRCILTALLACALSLFTTAQSVVWNDMGVERRTNQQIVPATYRTISVDFESLKAKLLAAPPEGASLRNSNYTLELPTPDGVNATFKIVEESTMEPGLQDRFPEIRTFIGLGTGEYSGATASLDFTLKGFHAQILMSGKSFFIDPIAPGDLNTYIVYTRDSFFETNLKQMAHCEPDDIGLPQPNAAGSHNDENNSENGNGPVPSGPNGTELRTYQLALACTGEYAQFHGGTVPLALSAMTTTMNRVNGIYRSELSMRMLLIANNDDIVFTNPITDGYTNNSGSAMLGENQTIINAEIGAANYDIGHVFSTGGGGIASVAVVCNNGSKARGVTGQSSPIGDPFDVDYVAHELGHQWGARHTFNNSCGGNRFTNGAYEPGSGSTIMAYAGICSPNLQSNSDDYFHNYSYNQIRVFSVLGSGNSCATVTPANNAPPVITMPSGGFFIPRSTPFELTASATDPNGDGMEYCWEQYNLGPVTASGDNNLTNPSGNAPIFRSWEPTSSTTRIFPRITDLVNNTTALGEHLPTYARNLSFQFTVRDSWINGAVNDGFISFDVAGNSGPFVVTAPNTSTNWVGGSVQTVTWNVANTTAGPVNCSSVSISLSTDGGLTYPTVLLASTANDGSASVTVPEIITSTARIKVKGNGNIFFDISNQNFSITEDVSPPDNDAICSAITINCGDNLSGTNVNAIPSVLGDASCSFGVENDVFYRFNATAGNTYTITVNGDNYDGVLAIYTGASCFSPLTELDCSDSGLADGIAETIVFEAEENQQIFIQTYDWSASEGDFNISLNCEFGNDDPCDAQEITCGETIFGSTVGANSSTVGIPSCGSGIDNDVFYKIEAIAGVNYTVTVNGDNYDGILAAYTGSCSGALSELDCSDDGLSPGIIETIDFSVTFNRTVYIQTYDWGASGGEFTLIVSCSDLPYDDPCDARSLTCGESFSGSSAGATESSLGSPSCTGGSVQDVFFKFTALADLDYSVTVNGDNFDGVIAAYSGNCDGVLTELDCSDSGLSSGIAETIDVSVDSDSEVLIQVYDWQASGPADFTITLNCPIPENDECADAITLSVNPADQCPSNQVEGTTYGATPSFPDACEANSADVYYEFNSGSNTEVIINLSALTATDLVLSVFEESCGAAAFFCVIGTEQTALIDVSPATTYIVRVHSFLNNSNGSFNICIQEPEPETSNVTVFVPDWDGSCADRDVRVRLYQPGSTILVAEYNSVLGSSGSFEILDVPIGTFDVFIKLDGYLQEGIASVTFVAGNLGFGVPQTRLGDLNNDNIVNFFDGSAFNNFLAPLPYDAFADYNCDGVVNFFDASALNVTFGQEGDSPPLGIP